MYLFLISYIFYYYLSYLFFFISPSYSYQNIELPFFFQFFYKVSTFFSSPSPLPNLSPLFSALTSSLIYQNFYLSQISLFPISAPGAALANIARSNSTSSSYLSSLLL